MQIDTEEVYGDKRSESHRPLLSLEPTEVRSAEWATDVVTWAQGRIKVVDRAVGASASDVFSVQLHG